MKTPAYVTLGAIVSLFLGGAAFGGAAFMQQQPGNTSGPAAGKNVEPSTAVQKTYEGRSAAEGQVKWGISDASSLAAGAPAVEGKPGTQSGQVTPGRKAPKK